jgi:thiol-disulfide isomerase/thioredoxin
MRQSSTIILLATLVMLSCNQPEKFNPTIIIAGTLSNSNDKEITVYLEQEIAKTTISEDGNFRITFEAKESEYYYISTGEEAFSLFLSPGDSIFVEASLESLDDTFKLHGDLAAENTYLFEKDKYSKESGINNPIELMALDKDAYFTKKDEFFSKLSSTLDVLKTEETVNKEFIKLEEAFISYQPLYMDNQYPMYHAYIKKIPRDSVDFPMDEVKEKLRQLDLSREDLLKSGVYKSLIDSRISEEVSQLMKQDSTLKGSEEGYEKARFIAMDNLLKNQAIKDQLLFDFIKSNLEYRGPVHVKSSLEKFEVENQSPKLLAKLDEIKQKWEPIMPGKEVPDFNFVNIEGEPVKLSDLKGNLVYIDIWATWCGPCIAEHPHWDKMKEEYTDKPISFLTVSIDNSKEPWEKMVNAKNMEGLQWFAENAWKSDIAQHFMVNAIPRFLLLDKEGKVIDPSADRPSGKIRETVDKYL